METIVVAVIVIIGGLFTSWVGGIIFHIGPAQETLVKTLKDVVNAQSERIRQLESDAGTYRDRIEKLEARVRELEAVIINNAVRLRDIEKANSGS